MKFFKMRLLGILCVLILLSSCQGGTNQNDQSNADEVGPGAAVSIIEGTFIKDLGHPFSGPALIVSGGDYYRLNGDKAEQIFELDDKTKITVTGKVTEIKRTIPEGGGFSEITEKIITVESFLEL